MDAKEKKQLIKDLCNNVRDQVLAQVQDMPEFWDGHELRQLLADRFTDAVLVKMPPSRRRKFNNEKLIRNL